MSNIIATRRHDKLQAKQEIFNLIYDSYCGGIRYIEASHLWQNAKEFDPEFKNRKKRTVYINHVQPLADMLGGFLFTHDVERRNVPEKLEYIEETIYKDKGISDFMQGLAIQSGLYPVGVLIDMPSYDPAYIQTEADRVESGLNPYAVVYGPNKIRDFETNDNGSIQWVLLDDSYTDKSNPEEKPVDRKIYRLWTSMEFVDYEIVKNEDGSERVEKGQPVRHGLGEVPFFMVNWRDVDSDGISETPFEDIALIDRAIYNYFSLLDEMLASGTFKQLFWPSKRKEDIPKAMIANGANTLSVVPFPGDASVAPFYAGAGLGDIQSFITAIELYLKEIFTKLGMDKDQEKNYVQSGAAKSREFEKAESLLRQGARSMELAEERIYYFAGLWLNVDTAEIEIEYAKDFQKDDIDSQLRRMYELFRIPIKEISDYALERIVSLLAFDKDKDELLKKIQSSRELNSQSQADTLTSDTGETNGI